jgi:uncharacterized protein (DUF433 family)
MARLPIIKTPKVYVGGAFIRSESARVFPIKGFAGEFFANIPQCTRKDLRNAVEAAAKELSVKPGAMMPLLRFALSGQSDRKSVV